MKIFLAQIHCLFLFAFDEIKVKYRYHRDENISGGNLLPVPLIYNEV